MHPFFAPASPGQRFCLHHAPNSRGSARGSVLYAHPFAEEMNKSRRTAALQARALAAQGFDVLQIDLLGCGDSSGDFGDATWDAWLDDLALGARWLAENGSGPLVLWGLRLGALLALDFARARETAVERFLLWQPVTSGEAFLTQFLRLRLASEMLGGARSGGTQELRERLAAGEPLEIAGYTLSPALASSLEQLKLTNLVPEGAALDWFEIVAEEGRALPPATQRIVDQLGGSGRQVRTHAVVGEPFWITQEITECPTLIAATSAALEASP